MIAKYFDPNTFELCDYLTFVKNCKDCTDWSIKEACREMNPKGTSFLEQQQATQSDYRKLLYLMLSAKKLNEHKGRWINIKNYQVAIPADGIDISEMKPFSDISLKVKHPDFESISLFDFLALLALEMIKNNSPL